MDREDSAKNDKLKSLNNDNGHDKDEAITLMV
jgi:hypothetical protein